MSDIPNYGAGFQNPMQNFMGAIQTGSMMANAGAAAEEARARLEAARLKAESDRMAIEAAAEKERQKQALMSKISDPNYKATYDDYQNLSMLLDKDASESVRVAADNMNNDEKAAALVDTGQVFTALRSGEYELASELLRKQGIAEGSANNKDGESIANRYADWILESPEKARAIENMIASQIMSLPKGKEYIESLTMLEEERRTAELFGNKKAQAEAELAIKDAELARLKNERPNFVKLTPAGEGLINDAVKDAGEATRLAAQADNLAAAIDANAPVGGWPVGAAGKGWEAIKKATGNQDVRTALMGEYKKLRSSEVLKSLPPGTASENDVKIAMDVFPPEDASPEYIASFMRGMAKLQRYKASVNRSTSEWVNQNGSLGPARGSFTADGIEVKEGENFLDFTQRISIPNVVGGKTAPAPKPAAPPVNAVEVDY